MVSTDLKKSLTAKARHLVCFCVRSLGESKGSERVGGGGRGGSGLVVSVLYPQYLVKSFKWANFKMAP